MGGYKGKGPHSSSTQFTLTLCLRLPELWKYILVYKNVSRNIQCFCFMTVWIKTQNIYLFIYLLTYQETLWSTKSTLTFIWDLYRKSLPNPSLTGKEESRNFSFHYQGIFDPIEVRVLWLQHCSTWVLLSQDLKRPSYCFLVGLGSNMLFRGTMFSSTIYKETALLLYVEALLNAAFSPFLWELRPGFCTCCVPSAWDRTWEKLYFWNINSFNLGSLWCLSKVVLLSLNPESYLGKSN